jgi:hypothetical protein
MCVWAEKRGKSSVLHSLSHAATCRSVLLEQLIRTCQDTQLRSKSRSREQSLSCVFVKPSGKLKKLGRIFTTYRLLLQL